jgi:septum site-determining protein MinC
MMKRVDASGARPEPAPAEKLRVRGKGVTRETAAAPRRAAFQLRGSAVTVMVLKLFAAPDARFAQGLADQVATAPDFFRGAPVIIDLEEYDEGGIDFSALGELVASCGLNPIGVRHVAPEQRDPALAAGLALFPAGRDTHEVVAGPATVRAEKPRSILRSEPVRSGQQIYARGGDLILLAAVGAGAEVLADGNIHVYGPLRGRAIAGAAGDTSARIFCHSLDAELLSIAGFYCVSEAIEAKFLKQRVQISLAGEQLVFERLP